MVVLGGFLRGYLLALILCIRFVTDNCIPRGGGGLAACGAEIRRETDSCAGSIGRSTLTAVFHDALNGRKVCVTLLRCMGCWFGPLGSLQVAVAGSGGGYLFVTTWRHEIKISDAHYHQ